MRQSLYNTIIGLTLVLLIPVIWDTTRPGVRSLALILLLVVWLAWLLVRARSGQVFQFPRLTIPILALLILEMALLTITPLPIYGIYWIITGLIALVGFLIIVDTARAGWGILGWENTLVGVGLVMAFFDLLLIVAWYAILIRIWGSVLNLPLLSVRAQGLLLGHSNLMGGYTNLILPILLARCVLPRNKAQRLFWGTSFLVVLLVLYFTSSRSAWLGFAASMATFIVLWNWPAIQSLLKLRQITFSPRTRQNLTLTGIAILLLVLIAAPLIIRQVQSVSHGTLSERIVIWDYALQLIQQSPVWGHGPGSSAFLYALNSPSMGGDQVFQAHNLWLQVGVVDGLIGLGVILWAMALVGRAFFSAWQNTQPTATAQMGLDFAVRKPRVSQQRAALIAYASALVSVCVHSMLDYLFAKLILLMSVMVILALVYAISPPTEFHTVHRKIAVPVLGSLLIVCALIGAYYLRGASLFASGFTAAQNGDWSRASQQICQAARVNPGATYFGFQCAISNAIQAFVTDDQTALEAAIESQRTALLKDPYWYAHWANLASFEWQANQRQQAILDMRKASEMAPGVAWIWLNLAWMEEAADQPAQATTHYRNAICLQPWIQESLVFSRSSLHQAALAMECPPEFDLVKKTPLQGQIWNGVKALETGDYQRAEKYLLEALQVVPNDPTTRAYLAMVYQQVARPQEAWANAQTAAFISSEWPRALGIAALVAQSQGKQAQAMQYLYQAYHLTAYPRISQYYYQHQAYRLDDMPIDISPFLVKSGLTQELYDAFLHWADYLEHTGETAKAQEVIHWLEKQPR